jgi:hypothetical protein
MSFGLLRFRVSHVAGRIPCIGVHRLKFSPSCIFRIFRIVLYSQWSVNQRDHPSTTSTSVLRTLRDSKHASIFALPQSRVVPITIDANIASA